MPLTIIPGVAAADAAIAVRHDLAKPHHRRASALQLLGRSGEAKAASDLSTKLNDQHKLAAQQQKLAVQQQRAQQAPSPVPAESEAAEGVGAKQTEALGQASTGAGPGPGAGAGAGPALACAGPPAPSASAAPSAASAAPSALRIISWNANGLGRSASPGALLGPGQDPAVVRFLDRHQPDVLVITETKLVAGKVADSRGSGSGSGSDRGAVGERERPGGGEAEQSKLHAVLRRWCTQHGCVVPSLA